VELLEPDPLQRTRARRRHAAVLMRKHQCMHCAEPGCLEACPADGAIVQYTNGIVDFQQDHCIGCGYCVTAARSTFRSSTVSPSDVQVLPLHGSRQPGLEPACIKSCPTGCLHFGTKDDMKFLAENRAKQLRDHFGTKTPAFTIPRASAAPA